MNTYLHKPMSFGVKMRKLYDNKYIVPASIRDEMIEVAEAGGRHVERDLIAYVDEHGEWLDG